MKDYEDNILENSVAYGDGVILYQAGSLQVLKDGPMVAYGRISYEEDDRKEKIAAYWTKRSDSFLEQRRAELHSALADRWLEEIRKYLPERKENTLDSEENGNKEVGMSLKKPHNGKLRILDVGCGTGFFHHPSCKAGTSGNWHGSYPGHGCKFQNPCKRRAGKLQF